jgi:SPP1 family predicted phage head-tail adaptor
MSTIEAGLLTRRVTFQKKRTTLDAYGHPTTGWDDVVTVWARVRPISTGERLRASEVGASISHDVTVRWNPLIAAAIEVAAWRIKYGARLFNLHAPRDVDEGHRMLIFACTEGSLSGE